MDSALSAPSHSGLCLSWHPTPTWDVSRASHPPWPRTTFLVQQGQLPARVLEQNLSAPWRPHPSSPTGGPEGCPVRTVSATLPPSTVCSTAGYGSVHPVLVQPPKIHPPLTCAREGQRCAGFWLPYLHTNKKKWHLKGRGAGWAMTGHRDAQAQPQAGSTAEHRCLRTQTPGDRGGKLVYSLPANVSTNTNQQDGAASKMAAKSEDLSSTLRAHLQDRDSCPLTSM